MAEKLGPILLLFDGEALPPGPSNGYAFARNPKPGYVERSEQLVNSTRNANGQVVAQKINRRLNKFDELTFPYLSREQVTWLKQKVANFKVNVTYWDTEADGVITRLFYFGDLSAVPCDWDRDNGAYTPNSNYRIMVPTYYKEVKINIIDMGY